MREVSLFSGAGGGLLGSMLLGWEAIAYVEFDDYCQRVIAARIRDGYLPDAPIFGDIRAFIGEGYAASYQGVADVITAGFPCQPFSAAGRRAGADDPRNMWPATIECIRVVRPRFCLLENVPGLISSGYFGTILGDLAACGYDARWRVLSAAEMGAPHKRDRLWILADTEQRRCEPGRGCAGQTGQRGAEPAGGGADVADTTNSGNVRRVGELESTQKQVQEPRGSPQDGCRKWWATEPRLGSVADGMAADLDGFATDEAGNLARVARGVPYRRERLEAQGNGQVPAVVAAVWPLLTAGLDNAGAALDNAGAGEVREE